MKIKSLLLGLGTTLLMTSCAPGLFYQLYNVDPLDGSITNPDGLYYEDESCKISYNVWENGGDIGFNFHNKTEDNIYVKLNESHFILNGFAFNYFRNRIFTTSEGKSATTSVKGINNYTQSQPFQIKNSIFTNQSSSVEYTVSVKEDSIICIPPNTSKVISEYSINFSRIKSCDLFKYPHKKEIKTISYSVEKSPILFSNRITYEINGHSKLVENKFFVSEISNYPTTEFFESKYTKPCGKQSSVRTEYFKYKDIDKFYIKYNKTDYSLH
jgi:hypothetical protein